MRIYSNYTEEEGKLVFKKAKELGFTPSALQHYALMLYVNDKKKEVDEVVDMNELVDKMLNNLKNKKPGDTFIVSALLADKWAILGRSEKMTLSKQLAYVVRQNPDKYGCHKAIKGKTIVYICK